MHFQTLCLAAAAAGSALASPMAAEKRGQAAEKRGQTCTNGAVVFAVRGSDNQQQTAGYNPRYAELPPGMTAAAQAVIRKAGGNSYLSAIQYPAADPDSGHYGESVDKGILALQGAIRDYINSCKNGDIYVMGYSQGGQVVSSALAGSDVAGHLHAHGRFKAGVIYADPTISDNHKPVTASKGANNGRSGVTHDDGKYNTLKADFSNKVRSYCQENDLFCDSGSGPDAGAIHGSSPQHFQKRATNWLVNHA